MKRTPTKYWDYIKVEELLSLQAGLEKSSADLSNDEVMFITIHQIEELWMMLVLRELSQARDLFRKAPVPEQSLAAAVRGIDRMSLLMRHAADHFDVMETMTTRDYLSFRDKLYPASGFQSAQLREIEILTGLDEGVRIPLGQEKSYMRMLENPDGSPSPASKRVSTRLADKPTLLDAINDWLYRTPIQGSVPDSPDDEPRVHAFIDAYCASHAASAKVGLSLAIETLTNEADAKRLEDRYQREIDGARAFLLANEVPEAARFRVSRIRAALVFIESYRELPLLAWPRAVIDALVAFEQAFVMFRQRHARMVERVIGRRTGTGGSAGVEYLDQTALQYRIFRDVWAVRTLLVQKSALPPLEDPTPYDFASDGSRSSSVPGANAKH